MSMDLLGFQAAVGQKGGMPRSCSTSDFSDSEKSTGAPCIRVGDTRFGEVFVRDRLTSDLSLPRTGSPLANPLSLPPQAKFDPNTGKYYRSLTVDASRVPSSVSALELLGLFSGDAELAYSSDTHTGTVVSLAGGSFTFTCVGETHVHSNRMYDKVQDRLHDVLHGTEEAAVESAMGMSIFPSKDRAVEKEVDLVAESVGGLSLFAPADASKVSRPVAADSCGGMTMFSWEDEEEALSGHTTDEEEEPAAKKQTSVVSALAKVVADSCAGFTLFRPAKAQSFEDLTASESALGQTLFQGDGRRMANVRAETCGGITTFTERLADDSYDAESDEEFYGDAEIASESVCGWTDFTPALRALQQRPETYTAEQQWMSDLAWGVH